MHINELKIGTRIRLKPHVKTSRKTVTWMVTEIHPTHVFARCKDRKQVIYKRDLHKWDIVLHDGEELLTPYRFRP